MNLTQFARYYDQPMMMDAGYRGDHWLGAIVAILVLGTLVGLVVYVVRALTTNSSSTRDPLDIAKERYAKGEITKEELADIKKELK